MTTASLIVHKAGPGLSVQDTGRPGYLVFGLSRGGSADALALAEGAALLGQSGDLAALEMAGMGGEFEVSQPVRIALTGAPMRAQIDGAPLIWNASYLLQPGARLSIGPATSGVYGYLHLGGGIAAPERLGARSAHIAAGIGRRVLEGDHLSIGPDPKSDQTGAVLAVSERFSGGEVRVIPSLQTGLFAEAEIARFQTVTCHRDARGNRMGVRLVPDGEGFHSKAGLSVLSEVITPGDIQITGDGTPFVLLSECQTTGGYPRIGTVLPCDLPRVVQAPPTSALRFRFITLEQGDEAQRKAAAEMRGLRTRLGRLVRDPADISDLLSYQLIGGAISGAEEEK